MKRFLAIGMALMLASCSGGSSGKTATNNDDGGGTVTASAFPTALAVASPLDVTSGASGKATTRGIGSGTVVSRYNWATTLISEILSGATPSKCTFDPDMFLKQAVNASCYGPVVDYSGHPNAGGGGAPASGELPPGDVGIWMSVDPVDGHACAAAELNARMEGISDRSIASLMALASMVCTINTSGGTLSMPDATTPTISLTTAMAASAPAGVTFNDVSLNYATTTGGEAKYTYHMDLTYNTRNIVIELGHVPNSASSFIYRGQVAYRIGDTTNAGNCAGGWGGGGSPSPVDTTMNGSFVYTRAGAGDMTVELREGTFCGKDVDGLDSNKLVDAADKYNAGTNPNGWADNFNILRASYNPLTLVGDYAYAWQAGFMDGNTRVFNLGVAEDADDATVDLSATSFYGYGPDIQNLDPSISGFICNWAGPGNSHSLLELAQKQVVSFDPGTGKFVSGGDNITYAPTNSCDYDGTGTFTFDTDASGSTDSNPAFAITNNLATGTDDGTGTLTIEKTILNAGIVVPAIPTCTECKP
ncbi:MAG: hypothetical protein HZA20_03490 [Nitrospirae bacterium]|nr:hypothetical protein [Nitrospirota bacterium]